MFTTRIPLFSLFGIRVGLDLSWFLLAFLLVWSLSAGYFPWAAPGLDGSTYFWMGVVGAAGLFGSIIFHEFAHALVARRYDLPISSITLFIFGGVAEMEDEPRTAAAEFWMAIAGPIASLLLGGALYLALMAGVLPPDTPAGAVVGYLALINLVLAVFNMLPAFPLDGGRILRSALWWFNDDFKKSTRIAAAAGAVLAVMLIVLGVLNIIAGAFVQGIWQMLIGFFIYTAAGASRAHAELRSSLHGVTVSRIMRQDVVAVPASTSVQSLVDDYFYRYFFKLFPVVEGTRLVGAVGLKDIAKVNREEWRSTLTSQVMQPIGDDNTVRPDARVYDVLRAMQRQGKSRQIVADGASVKGIITMRDIMSYLAIRGELEETTTTAPTGAGSLQPR